MGSQPVELLTDIRPGGDEHCLLMQARRIKCGLAVEQFGDLAHHAGEEYVYVLKGTVVVATELYDPVTLSEGQSIAWTTRDGRPRRVTLRSVLFQPEMAGIDDAG